MTIPDCHTLKGIYFIRITIEPHHQSYVCAMTEKISTDAVKIGEAWISKDGIKKLIQYMDQ